MSQILGLTVLGLCILWVGWGIYQDLGRRKPSIHKTWKSIALRFNGEYDSEAYTISFNVMGRAGIIRLYHSDTHSPSGVKVEVDMRGCSPGSFFLFPESFSDKVSMIFGEQDIRIGKDRFDADFLIRAKRIRRTTRSSSHHGGQDIG